MERTFCTDLTPQHKSRLLSIARQSIRTGLQQQQPLIIAATEMTGPLAEERATFVTLRRHSELRGCVGSIEPKGPLAQGVANTAYLAAFSDTRFAPLKPAEFEFIEIAISVLSVSEPVDCRTEADLLSGLRPGRDGLILDDRGQRVTFLPQVWERLADPRDFVRHLKRKAGWPDDYWSNTIRAYRYSTESFDDAAVTA